MSNDYFWLYIIVFTIIFIGAFVSIPRIIVLIDKYVDKKSKAKAEKPNENKKHRYKNF